MKLDFDKIGVLLKNPKRNTKPIYEIRLEWQVKKKNNHLMYMDGIKLFIKKKKEEKELETLIKTIRIYSQHIGMEFSEENVLC